MSEAKQPIQVLLDAVEWKELEKVNEYDALPFATHEGFIDIMGNKLLVYQLNTGERIIPVEEIERLFGKMTQFV